ncbi:hypothetical protein PAPYR_5515 [Paratrimastix pyriformis]|uniref:Uncharacterized protein n=1 Tax=Paratrimastix pyriformis TaxID=342808 RepID=A0ABQ8UM20_9EUKA|nr:hypothetical protein PAPYR_5515 [Paratrimastix pyriformis]
MENDGRFEDSSDPKSSEGGLEEWMPSDGWDFLQGVDYGGCDICCRSDLCNNIGALKAFAQTLPNCVGFNTNGWFKHTCPEANRGHWTSDPACGFYRRTAAPASDGWEFLQGDDYGGCDICCRADLCNNIEALKAHAATLPNCVVRPAPANPHPPIIPVLRCVFCTLPVTLPSCHPAFSTGYHESFDLTAFSAPSPRWRALVITVEDGVLIENAFSAPSPLLASFVITGDPEISLPLASPSPSCAAQGFNTNGWFKHTCPEANRGHWTSDPACGFYRRTRPAPVAVVAPASDGWEFLQGDDYGGCDICCRPELRNNIGALKAYAQTLPNCVGFNTNGWFKHSCPEANRGHWTSDPACGFYRRTDGWEFLQGVDYGGCDICCRADLCNNIEALKAHAATLPGCVGFNTNGWFKHTCPEANRGHWTSDPACGFYRRTDGWEFLQGVDYDGCDICCRADLCNNIEALKAHAATLPNCVVCHDPTPSEARRSVTNFVMMHAEIKRNDDPFLRFLNRDISEKHLRYTDLDSDFKVLTQKMLPELAKLFGYITVHKQRVVSRALLKTIVEMLGSLEREMLVSSMTDFFYQVLGSVTWHAGQSDLESISSESPPSPKSLSGSKKGRAANPLRSPLCTPCGPGPFGNPFAHQPAAPTAPSTPVPDPVVAKPPASSRTPAPASAKGG